MATAIVPPTINYAAGVYYNDITVTVTAPAGAELKVRQSMPGVNLLNTGTWQASSGVSPAGFPMYGLAGENSIQSRSAPYGTTELVWVGQNTDGSAVSGDGGWKTDNVPVDRTKLYRFSVWFKKSGPTGSTGGRAYLGTKDTRLTLLNSMAMPTTPYFWFGDDLPLGQWHLVVGYVHPNGATVGSSAGAIYNIHGSTITLANSSTDFRWATGILDAPHWAFLDTASHSTAGLELWNPRIEQVNSVSDPIDVLTMTREVGPKNINLTGNINNVIQAASATATLVSAVDARTYTFQAADPTATLAEGVSANEVSVTLTSITTGAEIRTTIDGSAPTAASALYTTALNVAAGTMVKAKAFKANYNPSATVSILAARQKTGCFLSPSENERSVKFEWGVEGFAG